MSMWYLVYCVALQEWEHLFEWHVPFLHEHEVREFYYRIEIHKDGNIDTQVRDVDIHLSEEIFRINLEVPCVGSNQWNDAYHQKRTKKMQPKQRVLSALEFPRSILNGSISCTLSLSTKCSCCTLRKWLLPPLRICSSWRHLTNTKLSTFHVSC